MKLRPIDSVLRAITQDYTYHPDTGLVYKGDKIAGRPLLDYLRITVHAKEPGYIGVQCNVAAHCLAWYLTHGEWPMRDVDHIDGNGTNNKLNNLRLATRSQNGANRGKSGGCSSQYKGVSYRRQDSCWSAYINFQGKRTVLGRFHTEIGAAMAYDAMARQLFGEYALLNFPTTTPEVLPSGVEVVS
jgi:hypothetical protein